MAGKKQSGRREIYLEGELVPGEPIIAMSISGGKDSLGMWLGLWERGCPNLVPIYFKTGFEWEAAELGIAQAERVTGQKCFVLDATEEFLSGLRLMGFPHWTLRWCSGLKRDKINLFRGCLKRAYPGVSVVSAIGMAADETDRQKQKGMKKKTIIFPMKTMGMTGRGALEICRTYGVDWGGHYLSWDRLSCWCCPFQKKDDFRRLYLYHREKWETLKALDKGLEDGHKFRWARYDLKGLEARIEKEQKKSKAWPGSAIRGKSCHQHHPK